MPGVWQVLKFAWIQYILTFVFWYFLLYKCFLGYLAQNGVFSVVEQTSLNVKNLK